MEKQLFIYLYYMCDSGIFVQEQIHCVRDRESEGLYIVNRGRERKQVEQYQRPGKRVAMFHF